MQELEALQSAQGTHGSAIVKGTQVTPLFQLEGQPSLCHSRDISLLTAAVSILPAPEAAHRGKQLTLLSVLRCQGSLRRWDP